MKIYYLARENAFLNSIMHKDKIPDDAVEIDEKTHRELFDKQARKPGNIAPDENGYPIFVDYVPTREKLCQQVDECIDALRLERSNNSEMIDQEYKILFEISKEWEKNNFDDELTPSILVMSANAISNTKTPREIADEILFKNSEWESFLMTSREMRLMYKHTINTCDDYISIFDEFKMKLTEL